MTIARRFDDIVSGRRRGPAAALARAALRLMETPYAGAVRLRNAYYDRSLRAVRRIQVPVVSVGNLTLGGTGKTPMVAWLVQWFRDRSVKPVIVSRGYGSSAGAANDEARELQRQFPEVAHVQNPDRVSGAREASDRHQAEVVILDDGFQHRRLHRDFNIVLLDALQPFGYGHVFPRGTLREPISSLRRADVVVMTRADLVDDATCCELRRDVERIRPRVAWLEATHQPLRLANTTAHQPLSAAEGLAVAAFCGIGQPAAFGETLRQCGCQLRGFREFPDHHRYAEQDLQSLAAWASELDVAGLVCTQKDFVKIEQDALGKHDLWSLEIQLQLRTGQDALERLLERFL